MPQRTAPTGDGSFSTKSSAVMCDGRQSSERGGLFASDGADLGHFGDQHRAGNRADPRDGAEDGDRLGQVIVARDRPGDPVFQFLYQAVDPLLQFAVETLEHRSGPQFLVRPDLGQKPFAHLDQLGPLRRQCFEKTQLFCGKAAACFGPEGEEAGDELRINPVGLGARTTALGKRLDLCVRISRELGGDFA